MQEIYNYPNEAKGDLMPDVREVQQLSELLELQNIIS